MTKASENAPSTLKKKAKWWEQRTPHFYPLTYLKLAEERGFTASLLLKNANLPEDLFDRADRSISFAELSSIVAAVISAIGIEAIGLEVGWRMPPTAFGNVGYALLCSQNLRQALLNLQRFWHLIATGIFLKLDEFDQRLDVQFTLDDATPGLYKPLVIECTLASFYRGIQIMQPEALEHCEIWFSTPRPAHFEQVVKRLGNVMFDMPVNKISMAADLLDAPLELFNATGLKFAIEQCEKEAALSGLPSNSIRASVANKLVADAYGYPCLEEICKYLHMTERTLRRKLQLEGCRYQTLLEEARRRDSTRYLDRNDLDIHQVAEILGYREPANFTRAFRKWTGQTPSQYRQTRNS